MPINVQQEERLLKHMTVPELRVAYAGVYGEETRSGSKPFLIKRILWRMQCNESGDISERARKRALEIANDGDLRLNPPKIDDKNNRTLTKAVRFRHDPRTPTIGSFIRRSYKGKAIEVTVTADGFIFGSKPYTSLSAIASEITGCHQNGFRFFRLNGGKK